MFVKGDNLIKMGYRRRQSRYKRKYNAYYSGISKPAKRRKTRAYQADTFVQEMKFFDSVRDDSTVQLTGTVQSSLNLIPQGVEESQRIGRLIKVKYISCRFQIQLPQQTNQADIGIGDVCRIMLLYDKQCNGALPAVGDILETTVYESFMNLTNSKRFRTLFNIEVTINRQVSATDGTNTNTSPTEIRTVRWYSKKLNLPIEFSSTTGALTEITSGNLILLYISAHGVIEVINSKIRLRYHG